MHDQHASQSRSSYRDLLSFLPPSMVACSILWVNDPTLRLPILVFTLPVFLRSAAIVSGIYRPKASRLPITWVLYVMSFTFMVLGWIVGIVVLGGAVAMLGDYDITPNAVKGLIVLGSCVFILAAWYWWPAYAKIVLESWPRHDVRIWAGSGNRWDVLRLAHQMQRMPESRNARWRGVSSVSGVVVLMLTLSALGVLEHPLVTAVTVVGAFVLLPFLHLVIVRESNNLCLIWRQARAEGALELDRDL